MHINERGRQSSPRRQRKLGRQPLKREHMCRNHIAQSIETEKLISLILAEKILSILSESGATEIEKLAALDAAKAIIPVLPAKADGLEPLERS